jgi:anti-sigma regulatory factor (Ser/Thr protein kinase)
MRRRRTRRFPREAASVALARTWLAEQVAEMIPVPLDDLLSDAVLGLSETATNAVEHGAGRHFRVACTVHDDRLTIETVDGGRSGPLPAIRGLPGILVERGRGLFIVDHISGGDWECDTRPTGRTRVRFHLKLDPTILAQPWGKRVRARAGAGRGWSCPRAAGVRRRPRSAAAWCRRRLAGRRSRTTS